MSLLKEISITELSNLRIGHTSDHDAKTGVTVLYFPNGAKAGCDMRRRSCFQRNSSHLSCHCRQSHQCYCLVRRFCLWTGCSADGVMNYLESQNIGYNTGAALVPLVCQSCIYDLSYGDPKIRPTAKMGEEACRQAFAGTDTRTGNIGAGTGATVGKLYGMKQSMKSGLGIAAVSVKNFQMAAIVVVNALGDIFSPQNGQKIAGLKTPDRSGFLDSVHELYRFMTPHDQFTGNTTIGAVITNGAFSKAELNKIASMTRCAYARCINPVATMADGDSIYAASIGDVSVDINMAGTLAAEVMAQAIQNAIHTSRIQDEEFLKYV